MPFAARRRLVLLCDAPNDTGAALVTRETPPSIPVGEALHRGVETEVRRSSDGTRTTVIINSSSLDGHRTIIDPAGGDLSQYERNPVVLIGHNHSLVAGTSSIALRNGRIVAEMADADWDHDDPEVERWFSKVKKGLVRAASIGFRILPGGFEHVYDAEGKYQHSIIRKWQLLEWSWVAVGSNPDALVSARAGASSLERAVHQLTEAVRALQGNGPAPTDTPAPAPDAPERAADSSAPDAAVATREDGEAAPDAADVERASVPDEPPASTPEVRQPTPEEIEAYVSARLPDIDQSIDRALGRA